MFLLKPSIISINQGTQPSTLTYYIQWLKCTSVNVPLNKWNINIPTKNIFLLKHLAAFLQLLLDFKRNGFTIPGFVNAVCV